MLKFDQIGNIMQINPQFNMENYNIIFDVSNNQFAAQQQFTLMGMMQNFSLPTEYNDIS